MTTKGMIWILTTIFLLPVLASLAQADTCYSDVKSVPASCSGGTVSQDYIASNGCRITVCKNADSAIQTLSCNKPGDYAPQYFEMYRQTIAGPNLPQLCLGSTCVQQNGYAKSSDFPYCTATDTACYSKLDGIPATCEGGTIIQDDYNKKGDSCRYITCSTGGESINALYVKACEKGTNFEMYKESQVGTATLKVCIDGTCISGNGYAASSNYPVCTGNTTMPPENNTNASGTKPPAPELIRLDLSELRQVGFSILTDPSDTPITLGGLTFGYLEAQNKIGAAYNSCNVFFDWELRNASGAVIDSANETAYAEFHHAFFNDDVQNGVGDYSVRVRLRTLDPSQFPAYSQCYGTLGQTYPVGIVTQWSDQMSFELPAQIDPFVISVAQGFPQSGGRVYSLTCDQPTPTGDVVDTFEGSTQWRFYEQGTAPTWYHYVSGRSKYVNFENEGFSDGDTVVVDCAWSSAPTQTAATKTITLDFT
jgi:hypothetical protein